MKLRGRIALTAGLLVSMASLAVPTTAAACPSLAHVKAFKGVVTELSFSGSATGSDGNGGIASITLDRNATAIPINLTHHAHGNGVTIFTGSPPSGGAISVDDTFSDPSQMLSGTQTASGPTGLTQGPELVLAPGSCKYQLSASFSIATASSGIWPISGPYNSAGGAATSPEKNIPKGLKLSGTASLPAYPTCPAGINPNGCYVFEGLSWTQEYDMLSGAPPDQPEGSATFSWSISPVFAKPAAAKYLLVFMSSTFIRAGHTSVVYFSVTWKRQPAAGALVQVAGHTAHTNHHGKVSISIRPNHAGHLKVTIRYHGHKTTKLITVS